MTAGRIANQMRVQAAMVAGRVGRPRFGLVSSYDPANYLVKVKIQPEDFETGWLPIEVLQAGAGWGIYAAPQLGDQAVVHFLEGDREVGWCTGFIPNDVDQPPNVPSGEIHVIQKTGSYLKLLADGSIKANTGSGGSTASMTLKPDGTIATTGAWTHTGTLHATDAVTFDKTLHVSDEVTADKSVTATVDVVGGGKHLKTHTHSGVTTGGGTSGPPT